MSRPRAGVGGACRSLGQDVGTVQRAFPGRQGGSGLVTWEVSTPEDDQEVKTSGKNNCAAFPCATSTSSRIWVTPDAISALSVVNTSWSVEAVFWTWLL